MGQSMTYLSAMLGHAGSNSGGNYGQISREEFVQVFMQLIDQHAGSQPRPKPKPQVKPQLQPEPTLKPQSKQQQLQGFLEVLPLSEAAHASVILPATNTQSHARYKSNFIRETPGSTGTSTPVTGTATGNEEFWKINGDFDRPHSSKTPNTASAVGALEEALSKFSDATSEVVCASIETLRRRVLESDRSESLKGFNRDSLAGHSISHVVSYYLH